MSDRNREGPPGLDGLSAFEIARARGFKGTPDAWLQSLKGVQGLDGAIGDLGEKGDKGERGEPGPRGVPGERGEKGERGDTGPTGKTGPAGNDAAPRPHEWLALFERGADALTKKLVVSAKDGSEIWEAVPSYMEVAVGYSRVKVMSSVDITRV